MFHHHGFPSPIPSDTVRFFPVDPDVLPLPTSPRYGPILLAQRRQRIYFRLLRLVCASIQFARHFAASPPRIYATSAATFRHGYAAFPLPRAVYIIVSFAVLVFTLTRLFAQPLLVACLTGGSRRPHTRSFRLVPRRDKTRTIPLLRFGPLNALWTFAQFAVLRTLRWFSRLFRAFFTVDRSRVATHATRTRTAAHRFAASGGSLGFAGRLHRARPSRLPLVAALNGCTLDWFMRVASPAFAAHAFSATPPAALRLPR